MNRWLLIHGLPTGGSFWSRLTLPGHVHAPDLPGFGRSRDQPVPTAVDGFLPPLRALAGPDVIVVGVDFGGVLAAALAAEGNAGGLVLMSTALGAAWLPSRWASRWPLSGPAYRWSAGQRFLRSADPGLAGAFLPDHGLPDRMVRVARALRIRQLHAMRPQVRTPTLCLWGEDDPFLPAPLGARLARQLGADWQALPGRHALAWTHPGEVSAVLMAWAARRCAASPPGASDAPAATGRP